jgi:hypothetical protein
MLFGEFGGALENALAHDFSGFEFHNRARRNDREREDEAREGRGGVALFAQGNPSHVLCWQTGIL